MWSSHQEHEGTDGPFAAAPLTSLMEAPLAGYGHPMGRWLTGRHVSVCPVVCV
jgi:hypothetical protein